ncbi:MAG: S-layer homology domain-containing protein [Ruminococcaceae bacterium]|nr:S-layer homology domain-containing protein [Oscillospiraceae bacterium]
MKAVRYLLLIIISSFAFGAFTAPAQSYIDDAIILDFTDYANGIVNGNNSATLSNVTIDGRSALKVVPLPENATSKLKYISVDGFSYLKAGINLEEYCWVAYEYYYKSDNPKELYMEGDMLTSKTQTNPGVITERIVIKSDKPAKANAWSTVLFDFSEVKEKLVEEAANHNLKQMHFRPFGAYNLEYLNPEDEMYISKVMFFKEKPTLNYRNAFLSGYPDGTFKAGNILTRAEACKMVATSLEVNDDDIIGEPTYTDAKDEWYSRYIGYLQNKGILSFATGKTFNPNAPITKTDFTKLVISGGIVQDLGDVNLENYFGSTASAESSGQVTRLQAAMMINQLRGTVISDSDIPDSIFVLYLDVERDDPHFAEIAEASFDHVSDGTKWVYAAEDPVQSLIDKVGEEKLYDFEAGNAKVAELDELEEDRIAEIRATENMKITTDKVIYVSSSLGSDSNDGRSEDYPVKTVAKANSLVTANDGWVILLQRGDLWRERIACVAGTTYSAYGSGDKPRIYGSPENGADQHKWTLVYENKETGALIWKYYREDFLDVGTLVFNNGEGFAMKEVPSCVGADYYVRGQENLPVEERTPYDYTVELDKNLEFFHSANSVVKANSTIGDYIDISTSTGPLYLRCDNGNPGKVFTSIEFNTRPSAISAKDNVTIDNLCIMYAGVHGISSGTVKNLKVTNCEIGWIGGSIQGYTANGNTKRTATRLGNGVEVYGGCDGYTIDNCYVYQCYDAGVTHQFSNLSSGNCIMNDVTYSNNVITECVYSIEYFLGTYGEEDQYTRQGDNILFDSNLMRRAGYGFGSFRPDGHNQRHIRSSDRNNPFTNYRIVNNIFDRSVHQLIAAITDRAEWKPSFDGNTFIQGINNGFYSFAYYGSANMDINAKELTEKILGDQNAEVYYVNNIPYWEYTYAPANKYPVTNSDRE